MGLLLFFKYLFRYKLFYAKCFVDSLPYYFFFHFLVFSAKIARFLVRGFLLCANSSVVLPVLFFVALNFPLFLGLIWIPPFFINSIFILHRSEFATSFILFKISKLYFIFLCFYFWLSKIMIIFATSKSMSKFLMFLK